MIALSKEEQALEAARAMLRAASTLESHALAMDGLMSAFTTLAANYPCCRPLAIINLGRVKAYLEGLGDGADSHHIH